VPGLSSMHPEAGTGGIAQETGCIYGDCTSIADAAGEER